MFSENHGRQERMIVVRAEVTGLAEQVARYLRLSYFSRPSAHMYCAAHATRQRKNIIIVTRINNAMQIAF
jgi:hypothetical protein